MTRLVGSTVKRVIAGVGVGGLLAWKAGRLVRSIGAVIQAEEEIRAYQRRRQLDLYIADRTRDLSMAPRYPSLN